MTKYMLGDLAGASVSFENAVNASATAPLSKVDTTSLYNAGFTAWMVQDYERAKGFFAACIENGYYHEDGDAFAKLADTYGKLGDKEAMVAVLEQGFTIYPQSQSILIGLINYYLENKQNPGY
jgi:tetratricopeptide (TPR) repeat protein